MLTKIEGTKRPRHAHIFSRDKDDRYVEPEWCSRRLLEEETFRGNIHDPAAGTGRILVSARAAGFKTTGADVSPLRSDIRAIDFFKDRKERHNIICNPPYGVLREFALHALNLTRRKVAFLVPLARLNAAPTDAAAACLVVESETIDPATSLPARWQEAKRWPS
jgi:hypothetical protein